MRNRNTDPQNGYRNYHYITCKSSTFVSRDRTTFYYTKDIRKSNSLITYDLHSREIQILKTIIKINIFWLFLVSFQIERNAPLKILRFLIVSSTIMKMPNINIWAVIYSFAIFKKNFGQKITESLKSCLNRVQKILRDR